MANILSRLLFAGFVRLHILYHADDEPICGVQITAELARHGYRLSPGTVYPALHDMEEAGYLASWTEVVRGRQRKYYKATPKGIRALERAKVKLRELADEVLEPQELRTRIAGPTNSRPTPYRRHPR